MLTISSAKNFNMAFKLFCAVATAVVSTVEAMPSAGFSVRASGKVRRGSSGGDGHFAPSKRSKTDHNPYELPEEVESKYH